MPVRVLFHTILAIVLAVLALAGLTAWGVGAFGNPFPPALLIALILVSIGGALLHLFIPAVDFSGRTIHRLNHPREIALTFDDGPNGDTTLRLLDILDEEDVKAAFFLVGQQVESQPEIAREIVRRGHVIGNHGYSHRTLPFLSPRGVDEEIGRAQQVISKVTGTEPTLFRPSHGFKSLFLSRSLNRWGLTPVRWTVGVWDTDRPGTDTIIRRAIGRLRGRGILLLHDGGGEKPGTDRAESIAAVRPIIREMRSRGFTLRPPTPADIPAKSQTRNVLIASGGFLLSAVLLLLAVRNVKGDELFSLLSAVQWPAAAAAALLNILVCILKGYRFRKLLEGSYRVPTLAAVGSIFGGYAINCALPARAGDLARFVLLERAAGVRKRDSAVGYLSERILEGMGIVVLAILTLTISFPPTWVLKGMFLIGGLSCIALFLLLYLRRRPPSWLNEIPSLRTLVRQFPLTLLIWVLQAWTVDLSARAFGIDLPVYGAVLALVVVNLAMMAPSAPAGIGPFEFAMVEGLALLGVGATLAFSVAILYHAVQVVPVIVIGGIWAALMGAGKSKALPPDKKG